LGMACTVQAKKANTVTSASALRDANIMGVLAKNKMVVMKVKVGIDKARAGKTTVRKDGPS
jgi:hypothetical protein